MLGKNNLFLINLTLSVVYPFVDGNSYLQSAELPLNIFPFKI